MPSPFEELLNDLAAVQALRTTQTPSRDTAARSARRSRPVCATAARPLEEIRATTRLPQAGLGQPDRTPGRDSRRSRAVPDSGAAGRDTRTPGDPRRRRQSRKADGAPNLSVGRVHRPSTRHGTDAVIDQLRELRDLLDSIERDDIDFDQGAMDAAIAIVDRLIAQNERPLPTPAVGSCYRVKTPVSRATAPPPPQPQQPPQQKSRRPKSQQFEIKRKRA